MRFDFKNSEAFWALLDQGVVSGGNFLTSLVLVRSLAKEDYGTFSLLFLILLSLNTLHSSLVIYPLTVTIAKSEGEAGREALGRCIFHTVLLWFAWVAILEIMLVILRRTDVFVGASLAMLAWQLQEVARRALLGNADAKNAIVPDLVSYVGQGLILLWLHPQNLNQIFLCIAGTSTAAMIWQIWITRPVFRHLMEQTHIADAWGLGKYTLIANTLNMGILQLPSWTLDAMQGRAVVGSYQALANLIGIANPILFSMNNMLIPAVARASSKGLPHVRKVVVKNGLIFGVLLLPCFVLLGFFPAHVMAIVYGKHSPYLPLSPLLRIFTLTFLLQFLATLIGAYEGGLSRPRTYMFAQIVSLGILATSGVILMKMYGITGAIYAGAIAAAARMFTFIVLSRRADLAMMSGPVAKEV
jgi:O-antigen/teichoic acid export membrane protein